MGRQCLGLHLAIRVACAIATSKAREGNLSIQRRLIRNEAERMQDDLHESEVATEPVFSVARPNVLVTDSRGKGSPLAPLLSVTPLVSDSVHGVLAVQPAAETDVNPEQVTKQGAVRRQVHSSPLVKAKRRKGNDVQSTEFRDRKKDSAKHEKRESHSEHGREAGREGSAVKVHQLVSNKKEHSDAEQSNGFEGAEASRSSVHVVEAGASDGSRFSAAHEHRRLAMRSAENAFSAVSMSVGAGILVVVLALAAIAFGFVCYNKQQRTTQRRSRELTLSPRRQSPRQSPRKSALLSESRQQRGNNEGDSGGIAGGLTDGGEADIDSSGDSFRVDGDSTAESAPQRISRKSGRT